MRDYILNSLIIITDLTIEVLSGASTLLTLSLFVGTRRKIIHHWHCFGLVPNFLPRNHINGIAKFIISSMDPVLRSSLGGGTLDFSHFFQENQ